MLIYNTLKTTDEAGNKFIQRISTDDLKKYINNNYEVFIDLQDYNDIYKKYLLVSVSNIGLSLPFFKTQENYLKTIYNLGFFTVNGINTFNDFLLKSDIELFTNYVTLAD